MNVRGQGGGVITLQLSSAPFVFQVQYTQIGLLEGRLEEALDCVGANLSRYEIVPLPQLCQWIMVGSL